VEPQHEGVADAYWRYYRLSTGSREDRLAAEEWFWACDAVWDIVNSARMPATLTLLDELLAHPWADAVYVGAGPVEDILHLDAVEDWDEELARRCLASAAWREAVYSAIWPDKVSLPHLRPYLRRPLHDPPQAGQGRTTKHRTVRDIGQRRRPHRG
jgi:hypothetical protein